MKKLIFAALAIAIVALAALPPVFGVVYEQQLQRQLEQAPPQPYFEYELADYDRGLYTSNGSLRVAFADEYVAQIGRAMETAGADRELTPDERARIERFVALMSGDLRLDIEVRHGPLVLADGVSAGLGKATILLQATTGELAELQRRFAMPYLLQAEGRVGLNGATFFDAVVPPMSGQREGLRVDFSGLEIEGSYRPSDRRFAASSGESRLEIEAGDVGFVAEGIEFESDGRLVGPYLTVGRTAARLREFRSLVGAAVPESVVEVQDAAVVSSLTLNEAGDELTGTQSISARRIVVSPATTIENLDLRLSAGGVERSAIERYLDVVRRTATATSGTARQLAPAQTALLERILQDSPTLEVDPLRFEYNGEPFSGRMTVMIDSGELPPTLSKSGSMSDPALLLDVASAEGRFRLSEPLAELFVAQVIREQLDRGLPEDQRLDPAEAQAIAAQQAAMLVDGMTLQGYLKPEDGLLGTEIAYDDGRLEINGMPMSLQP